MNFGGKRQPSGCSRDIVTVAMTYLDRMLSASMLHLRLSKNQCCLLSMACLKLAIKVSIPDESV
eukprot:scaffold4261_cov161-Skeletonema_menzelii.AAC.3